MSRFNFAGVKARRSSLAKTSIYRQSGVIPYRIKKGRVEILLVTSRSGKRWVIPKGIVEPHLSPRRSAAKEAVEEAGIEGKLSRRPIGSYTYRKWKGLCEVEVFRMQVERQYASWQEQVRTRRWFSPAGAATRVNEKRLKQLIRSVGEKVAPEKSKA